MADDVRGTEAVDAAAGPAVGARITAVDEGARVEVQVDHRPFALIEPWHHQPGPIPSLDGLRAIAVLIVVVSHAGFNDIVPGGLGVTIFFFLSGYLITTLLVDERNRAGGIAVRHFYLRRAYRLLPSLFVTLLVAYGLVGLGLLGGGASWDGLASQVFYFANYHQIFFDAGNEVPAGTGILWSLAVEEHFYIVYPLIMALALRLTNARRVLIVAGIVLCAAALLWRYWLVTQSGVPEVRTYYGSDTRFDSILFGALLALWMNPVRRPATDHRAQLRTADWALLAGGFTLLLLTLVYRDAVFRESLRYTMQGIALMPVFYYAVRFAGTRPFTWLNVSWLARIGVFSYAIYLSHFIILEVLRENVDATIPPAGRTAIALAGSIGFAALLDRFLEPFFRRRRAALH